MPAQKQDGEEEVMQSPRLTVAENLHLQMTRLEMAPTVKNWNAIARFFQKSKMLDRLEKDAEVAN